MEIIKKILQNYKNSLVTEETALRQIIQQTGSGENLNSAQIIKVNKMLTENSKDSWLAAKGTMDGWKEWYAERCTLKVNKR